MRTAHGLEPTPRSEQMADAIRQALRLIEDSVSNTVVFDPARYDREFRLLLSDVGELVFLPQLMRYLREQAPAASVVVLQASRTHYEAMLCDRAADIAVGHLPGLPPTLKHRPLFRDDHVVLRAKGAARRQRRLTLAQYSKAAHVVVDPPGMAHVPADMAMASLGLQHRVVMRVPHYFAVPSILLQTDLMVTVPRSVAHNIRNADELQISDVPFEMPPLEVNMFWHTRQDADPAHRWLRQTMIELFGA